MNRHTPSFIFDSISPIFLHPPLNPANRYHALTLRYKPKGAQGFVHIYHLFSFVVLCNYQDTNVSHGTFEGSNTLFSCNALDHCTVNPNSQQQML